jgi:hypothetical protein
MSNLNLREFIPAHIADQLPAGWPFREWPQDDRQGLLQLSLTYVERRRMGRPQDLPRDLPHVVPQLPELEPQSQEVPEVPEEIPAISGDQLQQPFEDPILTGSLPLLAQPSIEGNWQIAGSQEDDWEEVRELIFSRQRMVNEAEMPSPVRSLSDRSLDPDSKINRLMRAPKRTWKHIVRHEREEELPQLFRTLLKRRGEILIAKANLIRRQRLLSEKQNLKILNEMLRRRMNRLVEIQAELEVPDHH